METIAATIAQRLNHDDRVFQTAQGESLAALCGERSVRVEEAFGKKRFIFKDGSAITMGDGRWYVGFEHCFCHRGDGHFQGCGNEEPGDDVRLPDVATVSVEETVAVAPPQPEMLPGPPAFTIRSYGQSNSTIAIEGSRNKAQREARALLSAASGISHAWVMDTDGKIIDAYELAKVRGGGTRIKKIAPVELNKLKQIELPL
ncbi:MAG: hypothetical protein HQL75_06440 [Magnetococcales bacterium]|nr:hypothetical protein [Magnetococcales bacterium]